MKPSSNQAKLPPVKAPITNVAPPTTPATAAPRFVNLNRKTNKTLAPATTASATQATGVRISQGETTTAAVAVNPASTWSTLVHLFCHIGQKRKNGVTNNSCPLSIAPAASRQPHQNQRFFKAANAANR